MKEERKKPSDPNEIHISRKTAESLRDELRILVAAAEGASQHIRSAEDGELGQVIETGLRDQVWKVMKLFDPIAGQL